MTTEIKELLLKCL